MTMKNLTTYLASIALLTAACAAGCGSSSGSNDAGVAGSTGTSGAGGGAGGAGGAVCGGATLFGISTGDSCFDIVSVAAGSHDGCKLGVADSGANGLVGASLLVHYDMATATVTVGTMGSLGEGMVTCNMGTLLRENTPMLDTMPSCTWHQADTSNVTVTATNEFDIAVTEAQNQFDTACSAANVPTGGMCTSTWTWHMKKGTKTPPGCN
jgi:hypothetical protein